MVHTIDFFRIFNYNYSSRPGHLLCHMLRNPTDETARSYLHLQVLKSDEDF